VKGDIVRGRGGDNIWEGWSRGVSALTLYRMKHVAEPLPRFRSFIKIARPMTVMSVLNFISFSKIWWTFCK